jgi:acetyltransferase-like isoleucine patch superfamily enzyme
MSKEKNFSEGGNLRKKRDISWKDLWKLEVSGHKEIYRLHQILREGIMKRWHRCLPFNEELFDRWERAKFLGFGEGTSIYDSSIVIGDVKVGENTWIGPYTILDGSGGLVIGDFCAISSGVQIYTHDSVKWALSGGKIKYEYASVEIGNCCFIGPLSVISKGVKIGERSLIGAGSFVNKDIPSYSIAFGTPAKIVGKVKELSNGKIKLIYY